MTSRVAPVTLAQPKALKQSLLQLATLNIILCDEEWLRYHRYQKHWSEGVDLATIDNGAGDHMYIFFTEKGAVIKGFDHESPVSPHARDEYQVWEGMYDGLPNHFDALLTDEAIEKEEVTFCFWNKSGQWRQGNVVFNNGEDDGSGFLLGTLFDDPVEFKDWADDYFEMELSLETIASIYDGMPITDDQIKALNPEADLVTVREALDQIER